MTICLGPPRHAAKDSSIKSAVSMYFFFFSAVLDKCIIKAAEVKLMAICGI